jgi:hypothetical protein
MYIVNENRYIVYICTKLPMHSTKVTVVTKELFYLVIDEKLVIIVLKDTCYLL